MKYFSNEICKMCRVSSYRLYQLRKTIVKKYKGKEYTYPPLLIEGIDYAYYGTRVGYFDSTIQKINGNYKE